MCMYTPEKSAESIKRTQCNLYLENVNKPTFSKIQTL